LFFTFTIFLTSESIEEGAANVRDEAHDEKSPSSNPYYIFLKTPHHPQIARKGIKWVNEGSKWSCKVGEYCNEITKW
jgi:hypothetical protein